MAGNYDHSRPLETACPPCVLVGVGGWELLVTAGLIGGALAANDLQNQMTVNPDAGKGTNTGHPPADLSDLPNHTGGSILEQDKNSAIISDPITNTDQGWTETVTANPDAGKGTNTGHPPADLSDLPNHTGGSILEQDKNSAIISDPITNTDQGWTETVTANPDAGKGTVVTWTAGNKIKGQMGNRGWTDADIDAAIAAGPTGTSVDTRWTDTGGKLNDPATVYGTSGNYVVINNKTGDVAQVSNKKDSKWVDDENIKWNK